MSEELSEFERTLYLDLSWCPPDTIIEGHRLRSMSLGSHHAMEMMGLRLLDENAELELADETKQVAAYIWLHTEKLEDVWRALWNGAWLEVLLGIEEPDRVIVEEFRALAVRLRSMSTAAAVEIIPRELSNDDDTPSRVVGPSQFAHRVAMVMAATGKGWRHVAWKMPLAVALQIYHAQMRWQGQWTARPKTEVPVADFSEFSVAAIDTPPMT